MKTLIYNSVTNKVISQIFDNGYLVDGKTQEVLPTIYELEYDAAKAIINGYTTVADVLHLQGPQDQIDTVKESLEAIT